MQKVEYFAIAAILDENNQITEMTKAKKLSVFHKKEQKWTLREEVLLPDLLGGSVVDIRKVLDNIIQGIKDCKFIVGKSITGVVYQILNNAGFIISEVDAFNTENLDSLYADIMKAVYDYQQEDEKNNIPTAPVETELKGNYFFDFNLLKSSGLPYTSKSTILPFLNSTSFNRLEIICDHVMPWFEAEMERRNLRYSVTKIKEGKYRLIVEPSV